jgi:hypothetical protein
MPRNNSPEYGSLIPCRIAALGPATEREPRLLGLQRAVYLPIVWLGGLGTGEPAPDRPSPAVSRPRTEPVV